MTYSELFTYCMSKPFVEETYPFGPENVVFKVAGKMFAICGIDDPDFVNLKCDPERAIELRLNHPDDITPGYHMSKKHWNSVVLNGMLPTLQILELVDHSYDLVVESLPKKTRLDLGL
ncbi:MAG: MmcQ/YjbR family DNA-binding protein [Bacteroidetes bacterium]|nr:MmcQ/YjbR family DNA-binding protein [Bacteroidota bacterium]